MADQTPIPGDETARPDGATESNRNDPTYEDYDVSWGLKQAKQQLAGVKADQLADPDADTDPDDAAVMAAIEEAEAALDRAIVAQSKDSRPDDRSSIVPPATTPPRASNFATPKRAMTSLTERAPAHDVQIEMRMDDDSTVGTFIGYASTTGEGYNVRDWLGEYEETINAGAFAKTLREAIDVPLLFNHDGIPIASTDSGTSRLAEDGSGLRNEADLDRRDQLTNTLCIQLYRGVLKKMSFSFRAIKETWNDTYDSRGVNELALYDTSIVTYPANPGTSAGMAEAVRSAMGREGRSLWLAEHELSVRSALPALIEQRELESDTEDLLERALRALAHADEALMRSHGPQGRARTFQVARAMTELRSGKVLSAANQQLLNTALSALSAADRQHDKLKASHAKAHDAVADVLAAAGGDGQDSNQGAGNEDPISPPDGAGARAASLRLQRQREVELRSLRSRYRR